MSSFFGTIDYLNRNIDYKSYRADKAVRKIAGGGDPVRSVAESEGSGGVHFAANLQNLNKYKRGSINAFQNALSMMQMQSEGLRQAEKIYNRMLSVAQMASDPSADSQTRDLLSKEFADLRDQSIAINAMTINGTDLFDSRAASTQYSVDFTGNTSQAPGTQTGFDSSGRPYWDITKDVIYNSGKLTINHRPFSAWDKVTIFQEDPSNPIFDTGEWTSSNEFDRFIVRYGPDQETKFKFQPQDTNGDGTYQNKSRYLSQLGLGDDGTPSGWDSRKDTEYQNLGMVTTNKSDPSTSSLTVRITATGSVFDIDVKWDPLEMDDSVVGRKDDMQVNLNQMGLGYLRENETGFPTISVGTTADALSAIDVLRAEIDNLGEQNGRIASNLNRVEIAMDAAQKQLMTQEKVLAQSGAGDITADLLELSKTRIERQQNAALMTQAMSIHQDLVNLLI